MGGRDKNFEDPRSFEHRNHKNKIYKKHIFAETPFSVYGRLDAAFYGMEEQDRWQTATAWTFGLHTFYVINLLIYLCYYL
jgi:hypothetical protein